jgi:hypothetical protein
VTSFQFGADDSLPQFLERRFYDFNVRSHKKKIERLEYTHMNPVKRSLVASPGDWVEFLFLVRAGLLRDTSDQLVHSRKQNL